MNLRGTLLFISILVTAGANTLPVTPSTPSTTKPTTTKPTTTGTSTTTTPRTYFPPGPARNAIHNPHPNEAEVKLLETCKTKVDQLLVEWKRTPTAKKFDWRKQGVVLPVHDMEQCSAAYAFSVVAMLESQFKITHGELKPFSVQQLVDCCAPKQFETFGCAGGRAVNTLSCIQHMAGLQTYRDYPWQGRQGACRFSITQAEIQVKGFHVFAGEETIRYFVWKRGPVTAHINPTLLVNNYGGGVIRHSATCEASVAQLKHVVVIVGFSETKDGLKYWIVRNSWGPRWGYSGFFYIERGSNTCGIETLALIGNIE